MWAPTSLIIHLVSVGCGDTFFFTEIALRCTALICSVLSSTWETDLAVKANSPKHTVWSEALISLPACSLLNNMAALAARLSSQLQPFSHADSFWWWGVSQFIDIEGGSLLWSIFTGALDASGLKGINWGAKSPVSIALTDSLCLAHFLMVQWSWAWSPFRLPS